MIFNQRWTPLRGLSCCLGLFLLFCILLPLKCYTIEGAESNENSPTLSAYIDGEPKIYLNDLSDSTVVTDSWVYNEIKTLHIEADVSDFDSETRFFEITLPVGIRLQSNPSTLVDDRTILSVDKSRFQQEVIYGFNNYTYKPSSGILTYKISSEASYISLDLLVAVDNTLWDMVNNSSACASDNFAIQVTVGDALTQENLKLDQVLTVGRNWNSYFDSSTPSYFLNKSDLTISNTLSVNYIQDSYSRFHKKVTTFIDIPSYEYQEDGVMKKKYATLKNIQVNQGGNYTIEDNRIYLQWENVYTKTLTFSLTICFEDELASETAVTYSFGEIMTQNYFTNEITSVRSSQLKKIYLIPDSMEKVSIAGNGSEVYLDHKATINKVSNHLGSIRLRNEGALSSNKKLSIEFPSGKDSGVGVNGIRLITPSEAGVYTLNISIWDADTFEEFSDEITIKKPASSSTISGHYLSMNDVLSNLTISIPNSSNRRLFFKNLSYEIGKLPAGFLGFSTGGQKGLSSSGNIYGVALTPAIPDAQYPTTYTLESFSDAGELLDSIHGKFNTKTVASSKTVVGITAANFYDTKGSALTNISAGEKFLIKGEMKGSNYPYFATSYLSTPIVYVRLPEGVYIDKSITQFYSVASGKQTSLDYVVSNARKLKDGSNVFEITFSDENFGIGYYTEDLKEVAYLNYSIGIGTLRSMKTTALNIKELLFIGDAKIPTVGSGAWDTYYVKDKLDINNNGSNTDQIATHPKDIYFNITSSGNWLEAELSIAVNNQPYDFFKAIISKPDDRLTIKLAINNSDAGYVQKDDFYYLIPIPKKEVVYSEDFKDLSETFDFDLELLELPIDPPGFEILYSSDNQTFVDKSSISDLSSITLLKIIASEDIKPGASADILIPLTYVSNTLSPIAQERYDVVFKSYGYQKYRKNNNIYAFKHVFEPLDIEYLSPAEFEKEPFSQTAVEGGATSFTVSISDWGIPAAKGHWQYRTSSTSNWMDTPVTQLTYSIDQVSREMNGYQYRYVLENKAGVVCSEPATLGVYGLSISIPKTIQLPINTSQAPYQISVIGAIPTGKSVEIYPIHVDAALRTFELQEVASIKPPISARVFQDQTLVRSQELHLTTPTYLNGQIQLSNLSAGSWTGSFNFYINFD